MKGATKKSNSGNSTLKKEWQKLPTRRAQMHLGGRTFRIEYCKSSDSVA
jgi:hypothetical protein